MKRTFDGAISREAYLGKDEDLTIFKISEVISILEKAKKRFGDVNVAVQCRDLGGGL